MQYERTCQIERADSAEPGMIGGVLATDGEAEDGHILNIPGGRLESGSPLLFEHGRISEMGPLGSWVSFEKVTGTRMGESKILGQAKVELDGDGPWLPQRRDVFHMIDKKHIRGFSIRWDIDGETPVLRSSLPKSHIANVDRSVSGARGRGMYFPKWRMVEGSVAVMGKDQGAVIERIQRCDDPDLTSFWRSVMEIEAEAVDAIVETAERSDSESEYRRIIEEANALYLRTNERLSMALDVYEQANEIHLSTIASDAAIADRIDEVLNRSKEERTQRDDSDETAAPEVEQEQPAAPLPATETPREVARMLREGLAQAALEVSQNMRSDINALRGKVNNE